MSPSRLALLLGGSAVAGLLAAVVIADAAQDEPETASTVNTEDVVVDETVRPVPVVSPSEPGTALSQAVALISIVPPDGDVIGSLLGTWGAEVVEEADDQPESDPAVDDERLFRTEIGPVFTDPCFDDLEGEGCPDPDDVVPAEVEGDPPLGPNAAVVHAYPRPDAELVGECGFDSLAPDELAIAVATANPGTIALSVGTQTFTDVATDDEVAEFDEWRATGEVPRPPSSFVTHCLAVPRPTTPGPTIVRVVAVDEAGQTALAETTVLPSAPGIPGPTVTPIDGTMVRVEVPLPDSGDVEVFAIPMTLESFPTCAGGPPAPLAGWRQGSSTLVEEDASDASAPYLQETSRVRRVTLPMSEGEPSLLCIVPDGIEAAPVSLFVTPPDARRLGLAVTEVRAPDGIGGPDEELVVLGTFSNLAWTPCGTVLTGIPDGDVEPGPEGGMCTSGGDTGAIAAAGGVLDLAVAVGGAEHVVRIVLSATPGGEEVDTYLLPIPAPGLEGVLCTEGVDQPGCVPAEGDAVLGTIEITATWDEGPAGPAAWTIVQSG